MIDLALELVAAELNRRSGEWVVEGGRVRSHGTPEVIAAPHPGDEHTGHVDLGLALNPQRPDAPVIWDCAAGVGATAEDALQHAVQAWATTTASAVLELLNQQGEFAQHYAADDPDGFAGWHAIHAPIAGIGAEAARDELQQWWLDNPPLPRLRSVIEPVLDRPELNGVKIFFGSSGIDSMAEVRVNGQRAERASEALFELTWPRHDRLAYVRSFVLLIHSAN